MATKKIIKPETPNHQHLEWLIESRAINQKSTLSLHALLDAHFETLHKSPEKAKKVQLLAAVCFSLWRAAFLADKTGIREETLEDVRTFLGKMLTDNAITYPQDRASREWTFNYYMNSAKNFLMDLSEAWPIVADTLSKKITVNQGTSESSRRWDRHQAALSVALECFRKEFQSKSKNAYPL
ncbi:MAG: hypothetical protein WA174_06340 [Rhodoferax sp.]